MKAATLAGSNSAYIEDKGMAGRRYKVSVGLPVYNGENYLEAALDSILAQTYEDFELIITDNASTDRTRDICLDYAARDRRIRYYRNEENIGAPRNFNRAFELSSGQYFKWAHHDDVLAPKFLAKCVEVLDDDPTIVLVHSKTARIEDGLEVVGAYDHAMRVDSPDPRIRFRDVLMVRHWCYEQFGVIRAQTLQSMPLFGAYIASDRRFMAELALLGRWYIIPEYLFFRRQHPQAASNIWPLQARAAWFDPRVTALLSFPHFKEVAEYVKCLQRVPLDWSVRLDCYRTLSQFCRLNRRHLMDDLWIAAIKALNRSRGGRRLIGWTKRMRGRIAGLPSERHSN